MFLSSKTSFISPDMANPNFLPFLVIQWNYDFIKDAEQNSFSVVNLFCNNGTSTLEQAF